MPDHGEVVHEGHHGHHILVGVGSKALYTVHIIIRYLWNGVGLSEEAEPIFDFSYYLLFLNLFFDLYLCLKVVAPLEGLNYIYKLLNQQLLILVIINHWDIFFINSYCV
ncbi:MAG: hypothetical protein ACMG6E_03775 [Candidatus Roizmanbacteria bacterium]